MTSTLKNWAGNFQYSTANVFHPKTVGEIQELVARLPKARVLGTRHSFNSIADCTDNLIALDQLDPVVTIDPDHKQATIAANVRYGELAGILHREGFALHNLASLPHISVVGACATATHGSGVRNQNLASVVSGMEFIAATGDLVSLSRDHHGDRFEGAVVHLGALGVVVSLTLDLLPTFEMTQEVYEHLPLSQLEAHFDAIMSSAYSVSLFTDWTGDTINQVWLKHRVDDANAAAQPEFYDARPATRHMHPIAEVSAENCTYQLGIPGAWHERLPHFRIDATPSAGAELQSEFFVARQDAVAALRAVGSLRGEISPHLLISEVRTIAADNFWMSPAYHQDSVGIHFTWKPDWPSVQKVLPKIEAQLAPFNARPHWGKLFTMPPARLQSLYARLPDFKGLMVEVDPHSKFRNAFVDDAIFGE
jgi:alditol oxidase